MNILISAENFHPPIGGAEFSLITLAKQLSEKHDVYVIQPGNRNEIIYLDEIKIITQKIPRFFSRRLIRSYHMLKALYWKKNLEKNINEIKPDLIITQLNFSPPSIDIAVKYSILSILFIRSYEHFCPIGFVDGINCNKQCSNCIPLKNKPRFFYLDKWLKWNGDAIRNADLVIANSKFVANITKKWYDVEPLVLYPTIDAKKYQCDEKLKEYITIIKPTKRKGFDIFLRIAKSFPEKKFLAVGGDQNLSDLKNVNANSNVKFLQWTNNIKDVYSITKILVAPVEWPEPFGRTIVEAGINEIPSIASNRGGLPEAVGDGGILIDNIHDINEWIKAINSLDDEERYNELSKKAKLHAQKFEFEYIFNKFKQSVEEKLSVKL